MSISPKCRKKNTLTGVKGLFSLPVKAVNADVFVLCLLPVHLGGVGQGRPDSPAYLRPHMEVGIQPARVASPLPPCRIWRSNSGLITNAFTTEPSCCLTSRYFIKQGTGLWRLIMFADMIVNTYAITNFIHVLRAKSQWKNTCVPLCLSICLLSTTVIK